MARSVDLAVLRSNEPLKSLGVGLAALALGLTTGLLNAALSPIFVLVALLAIPITLAVLARPFLGTLGVVAIIFFLPFAVIPVNLGGLRLTGLDVALSGTLLAWVLAVLVGRERSRASPLSPAVLAFLGLLFVALLAGLARPLSGESMRLFLKLVNSVLFLFTILHTAQSRSRLIWLCRALILGGTLAATIALALHFVPKEVALRALNALSRLGYPTTGDLLRYIAGTDILRATGTAVDPNVLGAMLAVAGLVALTQFLAPKPVFSRGTLTAASGLILVALLLTFSRSSWLGLISGLFFIAAVRDRRLWILFVLIGAALAFQLIPGTERYVGHLISGLLAQDKAAAMRLGEYKDALLVISQNPWFGVGFGEAPSKSVYVGVSSIYLQMAEYIGLVGLAAFLAIIAQLFGRLLASLKTVGDPELRALILSFGTAVAGVLVIGLFDHHFFNLNFPHMTALFWLLIGATAAAMGASQSKVV
ncbi:MAG: O-antigen ligase family protein [Chloroflexi bacterium]|nr:O-antigen ligase family protein [Chloroflexota bacterium]